MPLIIRWKTDGMPLEVIGDLHCWYNLFQFVRDGQGADSTDNLLRVWNKRQCRFGTQPWGAERIKKSISTWSKYCGVGRGANNMWARKTYKTCILLQFVPKGQPRS